MAKQSKKLLDQVRDAIRYKHYSIRTEESYINWIRHFILYHDKRHPREMDESEVEAYLTYPAVEKHKDVDFAQQQILVRDGKGQKDRGTMLPLSLVDVLQAHLVRVQQQHKADLALGYGCVYLPNALERKYLMLVQNGYGNTFFQLLVYPSIRALV